MALALGTLVWVERMWRRRSERLALALRYAQLADNDANFSGYHAAQAKILEGNTQTLSDETKVEALTNAAAASLAISRRYAQKAVHDLELERQLQYAADHPWEPLPRELLTAP